MPFPAINWLKIVIPGEAMMNTVRLGVGSKGTLCMGSTSYYNTLIVKKGGDLRNSGISANRAGPVVM